SLLNGGGTDEHCVRVAHRLMGLGHPILLSGPPNRPYAKIAQELGIPFRPLPVGPMKLPMALAAAGLILREQIEVLHAHNGRDYWPAVIAARSSGARLVLTRHLGQESQFLVQRALSGESR